MSGYFVVTGSRKSIRIIGSASVVTRKDAKDRADKYLAKHPGKTVMIMTVKRHKVYNRPPRLTSRMPRLTPKPPRLTPKMPRIS
jgi:hypothetical protein